MPETVVTLTPNPALDLWMTTPRFRTGPKLRCTRPKLDPGGGGVNVSRAIHRLGGATLALHAAGGRTGDDIAAALDREGVPAERCPIAGDTREDISVRETETGGVLRFVTPGPELRAEERDDLLERTRRAVSGASLAVGSGSLPEGMDDRFWAETAAICRQAGTRFLLDSHDLVGPALEEGVFCFRENRDAVSNLVGHDVGWPEEAADWAEAQVRSGRAEVVVLTEGADGALLVSEDFRLLQMPPKVEVRSAIGAGDSFVAGLCTVLSRDQGLEEALRTGVAAAAATLLTEGTELCRREDVERLLSGLGAPRRI